MEAPRVPSAAGDHPSDHDEQHPARSLLVLLQNLKTPMDKMKGDNPQKVKLKVALDDALEVCSNSVSRPYG